MSAQGRKWEHVEPRDIAGSDLPEFMRPDPNHNAIVGATWALLFIACVVLVVLVVMHP